jgi:hypothetical protein
LRQCLVKPNPGSSAAPESHCSICMWCAVLLLFSWLATWARDWGGESRHQRQRADYQLLSSRYLRTTGGKFLDEKRGRMGEAGFLPVVVAQELANGKVSTQLQLWAVAAQILGPADLPLDCGSS